MCLLASAKAFSKFVPIVGGEGVDSMMNQCIVLILVDTKNRHLLLYARNSVLVSRIAKAKLLKKRISMYFTDSNTHYICVLQVK